MKKKQEESIAVWTPQPGPQCDAICADWCPLIFYGGGKYSGKSDFLLGDYLQDLETYREHWQGIIFRRALTEFTELKLRSNELFPKIGGVWHQQQSEWRFPNYGRKEGDQVLMPILRFRYLERLSDIGLYEGHSYPWVGVDEVGNWEDPKAFFRLFTMNRYGRAPIPTKRIRATGNPGGSGHGWIKQYFVDPAPKGSKLLWDDELKINYMFIFGTYRDNKIGMMNDPDYANRMNRAGSPELVRALKDGDFSIVAGAFFPELSYSLHSIDSIKIPDHWVRFMSYDHGACGEGDPFVCCWYAVVGDNEIQNKDDTFSHYPWPRGSLICYRIWTGHKLAKITVNEIAKGIQSRERNEPIIYRVAGGDIGKETGTGPSIRELFHGYGINFGKADQSRVPGWQQLRERLNGVDSKPTLYWFREYWSDVESMQNLQHDPNNPNDADQWDDHLAEATRYGCMSRPWHIQAPKRPEPLDEVFRNPTFDEVWKQRDKEMRVGRR